MRLGAPKIIDEVSIIPKDIKWCCILLEILCGFFSGLESFKSIKKIKNYYLSIYHTSFGTIK